MGTRAVGPDVAHYAARWFMLREASVSEARHRSDVARYQRYIAPTWGKRPVTAVTLPKVRRWSLELAEGGVGPFTVSACVHALRQMLDLAVEEEKLPLNPVAGLQIKEATGVRKQRGDNVLTEAELDRLVEAVDSNYSPLVLLGGLLGPTWSEAIGLRTGDLDLAHHRIVLGRTVAVEVGGHIQLRAGTERSVDLPADLHSALAKHVVATAALRERALEPWLFLSKSRPKQPLRPNFNKFYLRPALVAAGLDPRAVTFHTLRHTAAALMLGRGVPVEEVSRVLGHSAPATTKRIYENFLPGGQDR